MLWRVRLLGGLALERDGAPPVTRFRSQKTAALLAYLALHPGPHARERLIDLLWPDDPLPQGQQSLRAALSSLRRQLEPPDVRPGSVLSATRTHAGLNPAAVETDVAALEAALARGDSAAARALATGPLLPDVYADWAIVAAEGLRARLERIDAVPSAPSSVAPPARPVGKRLAVPPSLDRFFGRDDERARLSSLLARRGAAVTILGAGGSGKTRLAAEAARDWPGAAVFVALADATHSDEVLVRLAQALGVAEGECVAALAAESDPLLVLDNAEHLAGPGLNAALLSLRASLPGLRTLSTSRQRLGFPGERLAPLGALHLPDADAELSELAAVPSVALFVDRAQGCRGDFQLTLRNAATLVELVQALEGVPLAIELAASWIGALTPGQIVERVRQSRLGLSARRGRGGRHDSLWAVAHSSYALLPTDLQRRYRQLAVFRGGASVSAAAAVSGEEAAEEALARLAERSLLRLAPTEPPRFFFPEALREFAAERLEAAGEVAATRARHAAHFVAHAETLEAELSTPQQADALRRCDADVDNFAAALAAGDASQALRLSAALWRFWESRGRLREAEAALTDALARPESHDPALGDSRAKALGGLGVARLRHRDFDGARRCQEEALALRRAQGDASGEAVALYNLASVASASADFARAGELYDAAIARLRPRGDAHRLSTMLMARGNLEVRRGSPASGLEYLEEARRLQTGAGNVLGLIYTLMALASLRYALGELDAEVALYGEVLPLCVAVNDGVNGATALLNLTDTLIEQGADPERIVFLAAVGESTRRRLGIPLLPADDARRERLAPLLAEARYAAVWERGEAADWRDAI